MFYRIGDTFLIKESLSDLMKQPFFRTHFSVETFFYITGLLTSYITLGYTKGKLENFSSIAYLVLRYLRLTPQLVAFMLLTSLLPIMFDGPLWKMYNDRMIGQCHRTWWHNLIYMQNIIENENIVSVLYLFTHSFIRWLFVICSFYLFFSYHHHVTTTSIVCNSYLVFSCRYAITLACIIAHHRYA